MSRRCKIRNQQGLNFLTFTICGWVDLFSRAEFRDIILDSWKYCSEHKGLQIWGYVIMSNHIHVIVNTKAPFKLENTIRDFKAHTARQILERLQDNKKPESRREWLLYLFKFFAKKLRGTQDQVLSSNFASTLASRAPDAVLTTCKVAKLLAASKELEKMEKLDKNRF